MEASFLSACAYSNAFKGLAFAGFGFAGAAAATGFGVILAGEGSGFFSLSYFSSLLIVGLSMMTWGGYLTGAKGFFSSILFAGGYNFGTSTFFGGHSAAFLSSKTFLTGSGAVSFFTKGLFAIAFAGALSDKNFFLS